MAVQEEDRQHIPSFPDEPWDWEEISLNLLLHSNVDQGSYNLLFSPCRSDIYLATLFLVFRISELGSVKSPWGRKKHRLRWLGKPRAIPQVILKLQDPKLRESALHSLSSFLFLEVLLIYRMMADGSLNERACMRLISVIILFQCIAANRETRQKLMNFQPALLTSWYPEYHSYPPWRCMTM
ncbi:uncharacterized protein LOC115744582 [Rhodamnia argentea]|uniref:Uncharacterized protein LOC115744582 n=1 Tax=Rhodamnia argentea TaxID=178133 RepID=A0ABM3HAI0_9MYRT|nr:uncharacterized protein LOC115744582 [Rhodamnia argentea]